MNCERGVTLFEVLLLLVVSTVMLGALMPVLAATVRDARQAAVTTDEANIITAMNNFFNDTNNTRFTHNGSNIAVNQVSLLVSDGDMPRECTAATGCGGGAATWDRLVANGNGVIVDFLERHLVTNNPGGNSGNDYPIGGGNPWRGPYMTAPINPDPWGNRYMVNAQYFNSPASNVIVLSAGPNEIIECVFTSNAFVFPNCGGDDIATLAQP